MANYMEGPYLKFGASATRSTSFAAIQNAISKAETELGNGYKLIPMGISGGGVVFEQPSMRKQTSSSCQKNIRLRLEEWPWIEEDGSTANPETKVRVHNQLFRNNNYTFLKSFHGSPLFTRRELDIVMKAIAECFPGSRVGGLPSDAALLRDYNSNAGTNMAC